MAKLKPNQFYIAGQLFTERPILYQTEMVQANLEDIKTQTRRDKGLEEINQFPNDWEFIGVLLGSYKDKSDYVFRFKNKKSLELLNVKSPYGKLGDLLWVRETWCKLSVGWYNEFNIHSSGEGYFNHNRVFFYKAGFNSKFHHSWKPSIHMPKSAARLWLMVEEVRAERVQDISENDAIAEGIVRTSEKLCWKRYDTPTLYTSKPTVSFWSLWKSINGQPSWEANPWVWVIKYRILSKTGRPSDEVILKNYSEITKKEEAPNES